MLRQFFFLNQNLCKNYTYWIFAFFKSSQKVLFNNKLVQQNSLIKISKKHIILTVHSTSFMLNWISAQIS